MGNLTEAEILDQLRTRCASAASDCQALALQPKRGPIYVQMRESLKLIENCCRQMAFYREDARWLPLGLLFEGAHQRTQHWLRYHYPRPLFLKLAENLLGLAAMCTDLETRATGRTGMILPKAQIVARETKPVSIILPPDA